MAASNGTRFLTLVIMMMTLSLSLREHGVMGSQFEKNCQPGCKAVAKCYEFLKPDGPKIPPSAECCEAMHRVYVPCLCVKACPPAVQKKVKMEKLIYVARACGEDPSVSLSCGDYDIPPPTPGAPLAL